MDKIQLKVPPDQVKLIADCIAHAMESEDYAGDKQELTHLFNWLHYRVARWTADHPAPAPK